MDLALLVLPDFIIKTMFKVRNANGSKLVPKTGVWTRGIVLAEFLKSSGFEICHLGQSIILPAKSDIGCGLKSNHSLWC